MRSAKICPFGTDANAADITNQELLAQANEPSNMKETSMRKSDTKGPHFIQLKRTEELKIVQKRDHKL